MSKILIFENQITMIENTFNAINLLTFGGSLDIKYATTSQEIGPIDNVNNYDLIIIDIDLSTQSHKDGFGIIEDIKAYNPTILSKVFVLTGSTKVEEKLISLGYSAIPVIKKPTDIDEITEAIQKILS